MNPEFTREEIAWAISAAYNSVAIINEVKSKEDKTDEDEDALDRNERHIRIMMEKEWFVNALTDEQLLELKAI